MRQITAVRADEIIFDGSAAVGALAFLIVRDGSLIENVKDFRISFGHLAGDRREVFRGGCELRRRRFRFLPIILELDQIERQIDQVSDEGFLFAI